MVQKKFLSTACVSVIFAFGTAYASDYASSQTISNGTTSSSQASNSGYASNQQTQQTVTSKNHRGHRRPQEGISFHVDFPEFSGGIELGEESYFVAGYPRPPHRAGFHWVNVNAHQLVPRRAVIGGDENGRPLFICHAKFRGGIHPGKVVAGRCNITYAGKEMAFNHYQVLLGNRHLEWLGASFGDYPPDAVSGGYEDGHALKICQAHFRGGMHPGKIIGGACNIGYGGKEVQLPHYNVLVA